MDFIRHSYLTLFVIFFRAGGTYWTRGINAWKGIAGLTLMQAALIVSACDWLPSIGITNPLFGAKKSTIGILVMVVYLTNFYALVVRGTGIKYESSWSGLMPSIRNRRFWVALITIGLVFAFLICSLVESASHAV